MVQISQTEHEVKIIIEMNRLMTRKPDVVLLPLYLKFNNPPIFFERHLTHEIDEMASFCRIFKNEARIVLVKKEVGIWPEIFQKLSKEELLKKRLEIADIIGERNKERDQKALERFETKRRTEIEKEVRRETAMRERVKQFQEVACRETLMVGTRKETHAKTIVAESVTTNNAASASNSARIGTPAVRQPMTAIRGGGRINVCFSKTHTLNTPKRESQEGVPNPFDMKYPCTTTNETNQTILDPLKE